MGFFKVKVRLENGFKITALLDTNAKINIMIREIMEDARLAIRQGFRLELVLYTSHSQPFLSLCESVKVIIGELKTRHPIFVVKAENHNLVFG